MPMQSNNWATSYRTRSPIKTDSVAIICAKPSMAIFNMLIWASWSCVIKICADLGILHFVDQGAIQNDIWLEGWTITLDPVFIFSALLAFVDICLVIIYEWRPLSYRLLWFWWTESSEGSVNWLHIRRRYHPLYPAMTFYYFFSHRQTVMRPRTELRSWIYSEQMKWGRGQSSFTFIGRNELNY